MFYSRRYDWRRGTLTRNTGRCLFFLDTATGEELSCGYNVIHDWGFQGSDRNNLRLIHLERGDEVELELPIWLLRKEGII